MKQFRRRLFTESLPVWLQRLILFMFIPVSLLLAYLLKDAIRLYVLEPIIYTLRIVGLLYEILPQYIWWAAFVLLLALLALRSLRRKQVLTTRHKPVAEESVSQVRAWTNLLSQASSGTYNAKWLLARQVARLTVDIIAHQERITPGQARVQLQSGQIKLPGDINAYVLTGLGVPTHSQFSDLLPLRTARRDSPLDLDPKIVIEYLEERINTGGLL